MYTATSSTRQRQRSLNFYLGSLGRHRPLEKSEEQRTTEEIVRLEVALWQKLLDRDVAVDLRNELPDGLGDADAKTLRDGDPDRHLLDRLMSHARANRRGRLRWFRQCRELHRESLSARQTFANANLRLVVKIARDYRDDYARLGDMVQDGNLGLLQAIGRFDPERGVRFATYAAWWIRQAVRNGLIARGRTVAVPRNFASLGGKILRERAAMARQLDRDPTDEELADRVGLTVPRMKTIEEALRARTVSWDLPDDAVESPANEALPNNSLGNEPGSAIDTRRLLGALQREIPEMSDIERDILARRYGLDGTETQTLADIGKEHNLSRERIRQLQMRALRRLRKRLGAAGFAADAS